MIFVLYHPKTGEVAHPECFGRELEEDADPWLEEWQEVPVDDPRVSPEVRSIDGRRLYRKKVAGLNEECCVCGGKMCENPR